LEYGLILKNKTMIKKFRAYNKATYKMMGWTDIKRFGNLNKLLTLSFVHVMQWIGKVDKNGVEIYECDYLVDKFPIDEDDLSLGYQESLLPVVWCDNQLMWCVDASFTKDGSYLTSVVEYFGEHLEVKGNIYEKTKNNE
jgi:hypothetical protein